MVSVDVKQHWAVQVSFVQVKEHKDSQYLELLNFE